MSYHNRYVDLERARVEEQARSTAVVAATPRDACVVALEAEVVRLKTELRAAYLESGARGDHIRVLEKESRVALATWLRGRLREVEAENRRLLWILGEGP